MQEIDLLKFLGVFICMTLVDVFFTLYTRRVGQGKAFQSGIFAMVILLFSGYVVISYVEDFRYLIAAMLGSFIGTYATVKIDAKKITLRGGFLVGLVGFSWNQILKELVVWQQLKNLAGGSILALEADKNN